jgi:hypothetical protein
MNPLGFRVGEPIGWRESIDLFKLSGGGELWAPLLGINGFTASRRLLPLKHVTRSTPCP